MTGLVETAQTEFISELFSILREDASRDPMFDGIRRGQVSRAAVKLWTLQAMMVVRQFTRFISAIHSNCPYRDAQAMLAENLWEEHGQGINERDHHSLVKKMARSLGATDEEIEGAEPIKETADYIDYCLKVTRDGSFIEGMVAIGIGIEHYMPVFFGAISDALCKNYGLTRDDVEFLLVHVEEDEDHARRSVELIERYADTDEVKQKAKQALRDMLAVKRRFARAIFAHCSTAA